MLDEHTQKSPAAYRKAIRMAGRIIDAWLPHYIRHYRVPGLSVALVHRGKILFKRGFGFADIEAGIKTTPETCYRIASQSKMFTAVAILQLAERRKLHLDDPVHRHLPWFAARGRAGDAKHITIRQLLSHSGGIFRDGTTPHWETSQFPTAAEIRRAISRKSITFENLTRFKYSNFGYTLLGEVIRRVGGELYEQYVTRHIIQPLGMTHTAPDLSDRIRGLLAVGYGRDIPGAKRERFPLVPTQAIAAAAGFISNAIDLSKFLSSLTLMPRGPHSILDRESKKEMVREYWHTDTKGNAYGLGVEITKIKNRRIIGHDGGFPGFLTQSSFDPDNEVGVIVLTNGPRSFSGAVAKGIFEAIYHFADEPSEGRKGLLRRTAARCEGFYRSHWNDQIVVAVGDALIAFEPETFSPIKDEVSLKPIKRYSYCIEGEEGYDYIGETAKFVVGRDGRVKKLLWGPIPLKRIA